MNEEPSTRSDERPFWKKKRYIFGAIGLVLLLAVLLVRGPLRETTLGWVAQSLHNQIRGEVSWQSSGWKGLAVLSLGEISIDGPNEDSVIVAETAEISVNPLSRTVNINLDSPVIKLSRNREGELNWSELFLPSEEEETEASAWNLDLQVSNGTLEWRDAYPPERMFGRDEGEPLFKLSAPVRRTLGLSPLAEEPGDVDGEEGKEGTGMDETAEAGEREFTRTFTSISGAVSFRPQAGTYAMNLEWGGLGDGEVELDSNARGVRVELDASETPAEPLREWLSPALPGLEEVELTGNVETSRLVWNGRKEDPLRTAEFTVRAERLKAPSVPALEGMRLNIRRDPSTSSWQVSRGEMGFAGGALQVERASFKGDKFVLQLRGMGVGLGWTDELPGLAENMPEQIDLEGSAQDLVFEAGRQDGGEVQTRLAFTAPELRLAEGLAPKVGMEVTGNGDQYQLNQLVAASGGWRFSATGSAGPDGYQMDFGGEEVPLAELVRFAPALEQAGGAVSFGGRLTGEWGGAPELQMQFSSPDLSLAGYEAREAGGVLQYSGSTLRVDAVTGRVPAQFGVSGFQFAGGGEITGIGSSPEVEGQVELRGASAGPLSLNRAMIGARGALSNPELELVGAGMLLNAPVELAAKGRIGAPGDRMEYQMMSEGGAATGELVRSESQQTPFSTTFSFTGLDPSAFGAYPAGALSGSGEVSFPSGSPVEGNVAVSSGELNLPAGADESYQLSNVDLAASFEDGVVQVEEGSLELDGTEISLSGRLEGDRLDLAANSDSFSIAPLRDLLQPGFPLHARGRAELTLTGSFSAPELNFSFDSDLAMLGEADLERLSLSASVRPLQGEAQLARLGRLSPEPKRDPADDFPRAVPAAFNDDSRSNRGRQFSLPEIGPGPPDREDSPGGGLLSEEPGAEPPQAGSAVTLPPLRVTVEELLVRDGRGTVTASGSVDTTGDYPLTAQLESDGFGLATLAGLTPLESDVLSGGISGNASVEGPAADPDASVDLRAEDASIQSTAVEEFSLAGNKRGSLVTIDRLRFSTASSELSGSGSFDLDNPEASRASVEVPYLNLALLNPLLPGFRGLSGAAGGTLILSADPKGRPVVDVDFSSSRFEVAEYSFHSLSGRIVSSAGSTELRSFSVVPQVGPGESLGRLFAEGSVAAGPEELLAGGRALRERDMFDLTLRTDRFPLGQIAQLAGVSDIDINGSAYGEVHVGGSLANPRITGSTRAHLVRLAVPGQLSASDYYLTAEFTSRAGSGGHPSSFTLDGYKLTQEDIPDGELPEQAPEGAIAMLNSEGSFRLSPMALSEFSARLELDDLPRLDLGDLYQGPIGGSVAVGYTPADRRFHVGGLVELGPNGSMDLSGASTGGAPSELPIPVDFEGLEVVLLNPVNASYRPNQLKTRLQGSLRLDGDSTRPVLRGRLRALDTSLLVFGRRIRFEEAATLTFSEAGGMVPFIEGTATLILPGAVASELTAVPTLGSQPEFSAAQPGDLVVNLHFNNLLTNLDAVSLSSDPPLSPDRIRAALLGQQVATGESTSIGSEAVTSSLVNFGSSAAARFIEEQLALRRLDIRFEENNSIFFNVEKEITPELTLLFRRSFGREFNPTETFGARYEFIERYGFRAGVQVEFDRATGEGDSRFMFYLRKRF